jgi:hypothetical protein
MAYVEEREFVLRFQLRCEFPDDYEGEADGYEWAKELGGLGSELVQAAVAVVARHPGWKVRPANRGRPTDEEVTLVLEKRASD